MQRIKREIDHLKSQLWRKEPMKRKALESVRDGIANLKDRYNWYEKEFIRLQGEKNFKEHVNFLDETLDKIENELTQLPIGHRYEGVYSRSRVPFRVSCPMERKAS